MAFDTLRYTLFYCLSLTEKAESAKVPTCRGKKIKAVKNGNPLSGTEVFQMFTERRGRRELELFYLKEVEGDAYRSTHADISHVCIEM